MSGSEYRFVPEEASIRLAAAAGLDQDLWKWVILAVFALLAVESAILARTRVQSREARGESQESRVKGRALHSPLPTLDSGGRP